MAPQQERIFPKEFFLHPSRNSNLASYNSLTFLVLQNLPALPRKFWEGGEFQWPNLLKGKYVHVWSETEIPKGSGPVQIKNCPFWRYGYTVFSGTCSSHLIEHKFISSAVMITHYTCMLQQDDQKHFATRIATYSKCFVHVHNRHMSTIYSVHNHLPSDLKVELWYSISPSTGSSTSAMIKVHLAELQNNIIHSGIKI